MSRISLRNVGLCAVAAWLAILAAPVSPNAALAGEPGSGAHKIAARPWAIILCKFADLADFEPYPVEFYEEHFTELGAGQRTEFDYFREVTYGHVDMTGSKVFGWFVMRQHTTSDLPKLKYPQGRSTLHDWGVQVAKAHRIDLRRFHGVAVVFNHATDAGSAGGHRVVFGYKDQDWIPTFNFHELGHGFDLNHTWSARPDVVYGDPWDIMSAMRVYKFNDKFGHVNGPGMNAFNLRRLGCIPKGRILTLKGDSGTRTFTFAALNRPEAKGYLMASIPPPTGQAGPSYLVEFRQKKAWDIGIPRDTVLLHEVRANGLCYLIKEDTAQAPARRSTKQPSPYELLHGKLFQIPQRQLAIRVQSINAEASTARVSFTFGAMPTLDHDVRVFECRDRDQNRQAHLWDIKFSPDSRVLLAAGDPGASGAIPIWDVATGNEGPTLLTGEKVWFTNAVFTPDGKQVVAWYSKDKRVFTWDVATGEPLRRLEGLPRPATSVAVSPDGRLALGVSPDQTLVLWELENGRELRRFKIHCDKGQGSFSPDSRLILTYGEDPTLRLWDVQSGVLRNELAGHAAGSAGLFSADGRQVLSFSSDKSVRLWNAATGKLTCVFDGCGEVVWGAAFLPGNEQVAAWAKDRTLRVWDARNGRQVRKIDLGEDWKLDPTTLALSPDGRRLLTSHEDQSIRLRELSTGAELYRYANVRTSRGLAFSPDGRFAASGSFRAGVYLLRLPE